ncbi:MAG TPA: hypothetical protein VI461_05045 [Chitinophagaceae bacterium]|nr:hypothetical protein [Chitinophagaceae bacterium]
MTRDKSRDDKYFNCSEQHELDYVSGLYVQKYIVRDFLAEQCKNKHIGYSTYRQVYRLIESILKYPVPG